MFLIIVIKRETHRQLKHIMIILKQNNFIFIILYSVYSHNYLEKRTFYSNTKG